MKIIDTVPLVPSPYGNGDVWSSADQYNCPPGQQPVQLRMRCSYTRQIERLTILYTGPRGVTRVDRGGPMVPGPHGALIAQASVISAHPGTQPDYIDVAEGDVLVLNGQRMVIADNRPMGYPHLITEAEWGLLVAQRAITSTIAELRGRIEPEHTRVRDLQEVLGTLSTKGAELRARYRPLTLDVEDRNATTLAVSIAVREKWPTDTAVGVLFKAREVNGAHVIGAVGTVVFEDGRTEDHEFTEMGDRITTACGFVDPSQALALDFRTGTFDLVYLGNDLEDDAAHLQRPTRR